MQLSFTSRSSASVNATLPLWLGRLLPNIVDHKQAGVLYFESYCLLILPKVFLIDFKVPTLLPDALPSWEANK